jgi:hypothetical protein
VQIGIVLTPVRHEVSTVLKLAVKPMKPHTYGHLCEIGEYGGRSGEKLEVTGHVVVETSYVFQRFQPTAEESGSIPVFFAVFHNCFMTRVIGKYGGTLFNEIDEQHSSNIKILFFTLFSVFPHLAHAGEKETERFATNCIDFLWFSVSLLLFTLCFASLNNSFNNRCC